MPRDFPLGRVNVRRASTPASSDNWGPHLWGFPACSSATANDGVIPFGTTINAVSVYAYIGNVKPKSDHSLFTEITADLIDPDYVPSVVDGLNISVRFKWPGDTYKGEKATLIFYLELSNLAEHPFYWQYVYIE